MLSYIIMNNLVNNLYNFSSLGQILNGIKKNKFKGGKIKKDFKLCINIIFLLISILIAISCNNNWPNRLIGIIMGILLGPLYVIYKLLNPSISFDPKLCLNINFKDRILSAFQTDTKSDNINDSTKNTESSNISESTKETETSSL